MATLVCDLVTPDGENQANVHELSVSVYYDRDVYLADGTVLRGVGARPNGFGWLWFGITANDDSSVTAESRGFLTIVDVTWVDDTGKRQYRRVECAISSADVPEDGMIQLRDVAKRPTALPYYIPGSSVTGVAWMADSTHPDGGYYYFTDDAATGDYTVTPIGA